MAIIKCKMCGGDLKIVEGSSVCECEYCGTRQTVPNADNEKKMTLFTRASRLLRNCEFDKASSVFENIVADFPEEAEAYWGLVLCKYGIEYVDDPATGKKVPTCHRSSFENVLDDQNYEQACENADSIARRVYRDEARQIEELRKGIIEVSGKEDPYDIFISYKETDENGERTLDSVIAQDIYNELTEKGYRVFFSRISLESKLGTEYEPYIFAALNSAKVMIVVGTDYDNFDAVWVKNEWSRFLKLIASGHKKTLIPVFKNMDAYDMPKEFAKLSAQDMGKVGAMQDLLRGVEKLIPRKTKAEKVTEKIVEKTVIQSEGSMKTDAAIKRGQLALEDGEWEKAKQYFDQALSLDAECAEAYFGIALAELRARDPESFIRSATSQTPKIEKLSIPENSEHIRKAAAENAVNGFLKESEIAPLYRYDLSYSSTLKGQQEIQNQVCQQIENNRSFSRALRFASGDEKARMESFKTSLYDKLKANVDSARKQEEENRNRTKQNYEEFLKETDGKVHDLNRQALAQQTGTYQNAVTLQGKAKTVSDFQTTITELKKTPGFQDTEARIQDCEKAITAIHAEETRAKQTTIYKNAVSLQEKATTEADYLETITELKKIPGFQDTEARIRNCEMAITEIHDRERLEKEEQVRKAAAKKKRTTAILSILAVLAVAAFFVVTKVIIPEQQRSVAYQEAVTLYSQGKYEEAISAFRALGDYKDSESKVTEVQEAKKEVAYQEAVTLYSTGDYIGAYNKFLTLSGYKDVDTLLSTDKYLLAAGALEAKLAAFRSVGSTVTFGTYEQDNNTSNGKEDIEWIVLANEENRSLLISRYSLDCRQYNTEYKDVTWETCSLRPWLNGTFLNAAFSADEQKAIQKTTVDNSKSQGNSSWSPNGGNNTTDQIFLFSYVEAGKYFNSDSDRICKPTAYAKAQGANTSDSGNCWWWLRSPGYYQSSSAIVYADGSLGRGNSVYNGHDAIRPAFWINLESEYFK